MAAVQPIEESYPEIRAHCAMLHDLASGVDGVLVASTYFADAKGGVVTHHRVGEVEGMVDALAAHLATPGANSYVGLQVMRRDLERGARGGEADIVAVLGLVADMDADTGRIGGLPLTPSYCVETSPGNRQPVWLFDRPLLPAEAKPLAAALKRATGSDHGTSDVAHVWRVPGTLNWPNTAKLARGRSPEPAAVVLTQAWDGTLVSVDTLTKILRPWWSAPTETTPVKLGDIPDAAGVPVSASVAAMLSANEVGDRSAHAARVVERLAFENHTAEEAASLFLSATGDWFGRYRTADAARKDFERMWPKFVKKDDTNWDSLLGKSAASTNWDAFLGKPANDNAMPRGRLIFIGDNRPYETREELIRDTVPMTGVGFFGGQSGALKSFFSIHAAFCFMTGESLAGREIERTGGVVYAAWEGEGTIDGRVKARRTLLENPNEELPLYRIEGFGPIADVSAYVDFERQCASAAKQMLDRFSVPLVAVIIDTVAAAGMIAEDKENDPGAWTKVFTALQATAKRLGCVIVLVHHYGKSASAGLRGSSASRAAADFVLSLTCDRDEVTGDTKNHFLHLAKSRDAAEGPISAISKQEVEIGIRADGTPVKTLILKFDTSGKPTKARKPSKAEKTFEDAFNEAGASHSQSVHVHGEATAPVVLAVPLDLVRQDFERRYVGGDGEPGRRAELVKKQWQNGLKAANESGQFGFGFWSAIEWCWLLRERGNLREYSL